MVCFSGESKCAAGNGANTAENDKTKNITKNVSAVPIKRPGSEEGRVYTQMIADAKEDILIPIIRCKIKSDSIIYTDGFKSYNALDVSEFKHHWINHSKKFVEAKNHMNGIENFWNQAKRL